MKTIKNNIGKLITLTVIIALVSCGGESGSGGSESSSSDGGTSQVGSTAKIVILGDYLISLSEFKVETYEIKASGSLLARDSKFVRGAETLFTYSDNLVFMGTETGAEIFELNTEGNLTSLSFVDHTRSCDPVVANEKYMFLTLRSGGTCGIQNGSNQLQVYNIEDINNPVQVHVEPIDQPQGLALAEK